MKAGEERNEPGKRRQNSGFTKAVEEAERLFNNKKYTEAAAIYRDLFLTAEGRENPELGFKLARCLYITGEIKSAIAICNDASDFDEKYEDNVSEYIKAFQNLKRDGLKDLDETRQAALFIIAHAKQTDPDSVYTKVIFSILDDYQEKGEVPEHNVIWWLEKLNPKLLSSRKTSKKIRKRRIIFYPSELEKYYIMKTKALLKTGNFRECIRCGEEALCNVKNFSKHDSATIKRSVAVSKARAGEVNSAIADLEILLQSEKDLADQMAIARIYYELGQKEIALGYFASAALNPDNEIYKLQILQFLAELFTEMNLTDRAVLFYSYICSSRQSGWKRIPKEISEKLPALGIDTSALFYPEEYADEINSLLHEFISNPVFKENSFIRF